MNKFFSVETPSIFREIELPEDQATWSEDDESNYDELQQLAQAHGTAVIGTPYRRG